MPKRKRGPKKKTQADVAEDAIRSVLSTTSSIATGEDLQRAVLGAFNSMIESKATTLISGAVHVGIIKRVATDPSDIIPKGGRFSRSFSYSLTGSSAADVAEKVELVRLEKQQKRADWEASDHGQQVLAEYASEHREQVRADWEASEHGKQVITEYKASDHGQQVRAEYETSDHGKEVRADYAASDRGQQVRAEASERRQQKQRLENGARVRAHARHHALSVIKMIETGLFDRAPEGTPLAPDSYSPAVMAIF